MMRFDEIRSMLDDEPRLLIEAELRPVQGHRFQATDFPDLGPAVYSGPDGTQMLLIESAQSVANRLESVCWNNLSDEIVPPLRGLSHIVVILESGRTSSIQEAHRLNSPHIVGNELIRSRLVGEPLPGKGPLDIRNLAGAVFRLDAASILHGLFLEKIAGRMRLQRLLSGFIEAEGVEAVISGGVKLDRLDASRASGRGHGNIPFIRTEFTAARTVAYFNLDLATLRGYGLGEAAERLLIALSLFKIFRFLSSGLRLRTACDLEVVSLRATRPPNTDISRSGSLLMELQDLLPTLIANCGFGDQPLVIDGRTPGRKE